LINAVNALISNGLYTERGIARLTGISQPQIHNVLKGARTLTPETADLLMEKMNIALLDLISADEAYEKLNRPPHLLSSSFGIPRKPVNMTRAFRAESVVAKAG
jgi:transcriptional regulator with XRE-family HTH domain